MRHSQWDVVMDLLNKIVDRYGGIITDRNTGKRSDPGQAICIEAFGPDWMNSPEFRADDDRLDSEPPSIRFLEAARRLAYQSTPDWIQED